ncbi:1654_t:CDS:2 [Funneliformis mosseae]|uniref:1654_t:CDS:1 n=1 Tax=Funneliformis mosseae TaxID=27381 RepID=A0A9N9AV83_FUNMO|nr:1654_t:CDS:2 [Funneliformis mosseae]
MLPHLFWSKQTSSEKENNSRINSPAEKDNELNGLENEDQEDGPYVYDSKIISEVSAAGSASKPGRKKSMYSPCHYRLAPGERGRFKNEIWHWKKEG